jgi:hypothetical protein
VVSVGSRLLCEDAVEGDDVRNASIDRRADEWRLSVRVHDVRGKSAEYTPEATPEIPSAHEVVGAGHRIRNPNHANAAHMASALDTHAGGTREDCDVEITAPVKRRREYDDTPR